VRALGGALLAALVLAGSTPGLGCSSKKEDDGTTPLATPQELPALTLRDDTPNLLLTWIDDKGDMHVELKLADVPAAGKPLVRVVVSDREEGTRDLFYVADLTKKRDDGSYEARTMSRRAWEAEVEKRREAYLAKIAPPRPAPSTGASGAPALPSAKADDKPPAVTSDMTVIIYGADWCRPCHEAEDYLRSKGVQVVKKDVEQSPAAAAEMRDKLDKSGQRSGGIPVIDVRGQILVGYSRGALDRALSRAQAGTAL
jgi:glutaredoxin